MKKLFALVLALCLLGSCAFADGQLVWEGEVAQAAAAYEGEFHTLNEVSAKIWNMTGTGRSERKKPALSISSIFTNGLYSVSTPSMSI